MGNWVCGDLLSEQRSLCKPKDEILAESGIFQCGNVPVHLLVSHGLLLSACSFSVHRAVHSPDPERDLFSVLADDHAHSLLSGNPGDQMVRNHSP